MIDNKNTTAFPADSKTHTDSGLTKREYFAGLAMQAMVTNTALTLNLSIGESDLIALQSVQFADSLLKQLEK